MPVERRYSRRLPVEFEVYINYRRHRGFPGLAKNLSLEGFFLATGQLSMPTGTMVELEFSAHGTAWTIQALVIHVNGRGIGAMFRESQMELYRGFCNRRQEKTPADGIQRGRASISGDEPLGRKEPQSRAF